MTETKFTYECQKCKSVLSTLILHGYDNHECGKTNLKLISYPSNENPLYFYSEELTSCYQKIIDVLKYYSDLDDDYYSLISLWTMGTYLHKQFSSYSYLFFNAMKGSGKSRLLKMI